MMSVSSFVALPSQQKWPQSNRHTQRTHSPKPFREAVLLANEPIEDHIRPKAHVRAMFDVFHGTCAESDDGLVIRAASYFVQHG